MLDDSDHSLFASDSDTDLHEMLQQEKRTLQTSSVATETGLTWEQRRERWLSSGQLTSAQLNKRWARGQVPLDEQEMVEVYKNLVVRGRPLKKGLNLGQALKVVHAGWKWEGLYERVLSGGAP